MHKIDNKLQHESYSRYFNKFELSDNFLFKTLSGIFIENSVSQFGTVSHFNASPENGNNTVGGYFDELCDPGGGLENGDRFPGDATAGRIRGNVWCLDEAC